MLIRNKLGHPLTLRKFEILSLNTSSAEGFPWPPDLKQNPGSQSPLFMSPCLFILPCFISFTTHIIWNYLVCFFLWNVPTCRHPLLLPTVSQQLGRSMSSKYLLTKWQNEWHVGDNSLELFFKMEKLSEKIKNHPVQVCLKRIPGESPLHSGKEHGTVSQKTRLCFG